VGGLADTLEHLDVLEHDPAGRAPAHRHGRHGVHVHHRTGPGQRGDPGMQLGFGGRLAAVHRRASRVHQHHVGGREFTLVVATRGDREKQRIAGQHHGQVPGCAPHPAETFS